MMKRPRFGTGEEEGGVTSPAVLFLAVPIGGVAISAGPLRLPHELLRHKKQADGERCQTTPGGGAVQASP